MSSLGNVKKKAAQGGHGQEYNINHKKCVVPETALALIRFVVHPCG